MTLYKTNRREARPVTAERKATRADYAAIMQARLGFVPKDCEWSTGFGPIQRCPLYSECWRTESMRATLPCELGNEELGIPEVVTNMPQPDDRQAMEIWADKVAPLTGDLRAAVEEKPYLFLDMD